MQLRVQERHQEADPPRGTRRRRKRTQASIKKKAAKGRRSAETEMGAKDSRRARETRMIANVGKAAQNHVEAAQGLNQEQLKHGQPLHSKS